MEQEKTKTRLVITRKLIITKSTGIYVADSMGLCFQVYLQATWFHGINVAILVGLETRSYYELCEKLMHPPIETESVSRKKYTFDEEIKVCRIIKNSNCLFRMNGMKFWQELEKQVDLGRSWQSLKQHFKTIMLLDIEKFDIFTEIEIKAMRNQLGDKNTSYGVEFNNTKCAIQNINGNHELLEITPEILETDIQFVLPTPDTRSLEQDSINVFSLEENYDPTQRTKQHVVQNEDEKLPPECLKLIPPEITVNVWLETFKTIPQERPEVIEPKTNFKSIMIKKSKMSPSLDDRPEPSHNLTPSQAVNEQSDENMLSHPIRNSTPYELPPRSDIPSKKVSDIKKQKKPMHPAFILISSDEETAPGPKQKMEKDNQFRITPKPLQKTVGKLYTTSEDFEIIQFVISNGLEHRVKGNAIWKILADEELVPGRSWQSLRSRFLCLKKRQSFSKFMSKEDADRLMSHIEGRSEKLLKYPIERKKQEDEKGSEPIKNRSGAHKKRILFVSDSEDQIDHIEA